VIRLVGALLEHASRLLAADVEVTTGDAGLPMLP
jgi:hypothetical protein